MPCDKAENSLSTSTGNVRHSASGALSKDNGKIIILLSVLHVMDGDSVAYEKDAMTIKCDFKS